MLAEPLLGGREPNEEKKEFRTSRRTAWNEQEQNSSEERMTIQGTTILKGGKCSTEKKNKCLRFRTRIWDGLRNNMA